MPNQSFARTGRLYVTQESTFGTAVTPTGSNCCRFIAGNFNSDVQLITRPDKTGDLSATPGAAGKKHATWDVSMSLAPNGAAGVKSDADLLLGALMGQAGVIVASTSVTYSLAAASVTPPVLDLWHYRLPSTINQQAAIASVVNSLTIGVDGTGNAATIMKFSGMSMWVIDSNDFSGLDAIGKAGLGSFPAEPGSPVTNGGMVVNYKGLFSVGGNAFASLRNSTLTLNMNRSMVDDTFSTDYATGQNADLRDISGVFSIYDQDDANTQGLWTSARTKTPTNVTLQIGTTAGAITTLNLKNVQMASPKLSDGQLRWAFSIDKSRATATSIGANDELSIVQT